MDLSLTLFLAINSTCSMHINLINLQDYEIENKFDK